MTCLQLAPEAATACGSATLPSSLDTRKGQGSRHGARRPWAGRRQTRKRSDVPLREERLTSLKASAKTYSSACASAKEENLYFSGRTAAKFFWKEQEEEGPMLKKPIPKRDGGSNLDAHTAPHP